ncbi:MAG: inositol monophosphatase family protein [Micavibrio sp.]
MTEYAQIAGDMAGAVAQACRVIAGDFKKACADKAVIRGGKAQKNGLPDFVTQTDQAAERVIKAALSISWPSIAFVGEECGGDLAQDKFFLVDPLDGTSNFAALRDYFAVCAAYVEDGAVKAAVIADPVRGNVVTASKGGGAYLNGKKIDLAKSDAEQLSGSQLECELPLSSADDFRLIERLLPSMSGMRKSGSTALDILNLVAGRDIVCLSRGLEPHDIAACTLIVEEAGGVATDFSGNKATLRSTELLAAPRQKQAAALALML